MNVADLEYWFYIVSAGKDISIWKFPWSWLCWDSICIEIQKNILAENTVFSVRSKTSDSESVSLSSNSWLWREEWAF